MAAAHLLPPNLPVPRQALQYLTLCFAFFPAWIALLLGQTATVLLLILTLIFISFERGENLNAAFCLDSARADSHSAGLLRDGLGRDPAACLA